MYVFRNQTLATLRKIGKQGLSDAVGAIAAFDKEIPLPQMETAQTGPWLSQLRLAAALPRAAIVSLRYSIMGFLPFVRFSDIISRIIANADIGNIRT